jgi:DNA repair protein RadA/Sms
MAKTKRVFICGECGYQSAAWVGRCSDCGSWNSLHEEIIDDNKSKSRKTNHLLDSLQVEPLVDTSSDDEIRWDTKIGEINRVLGGGVVPGSVILLSGDPGIGKSTLLLQISHNLSQRHNVLYVTGEESVRQIKLRAKRVGVKQSKLLICSENDIDTLLASADSLSAEVIIIDSIQTMNTSEISSSPGSVTQIRECAQRLIGLAKTKEISIFLIGHVNKDGAIAGPKVLEHMVDAVLYFEGERHLPYRIIRAVKNRFGSTNEIGVFEMTSVGLVQVENPSLMLLSGRPKDVSGTCVTCTMEGTRPVLTEIQALVSKSSYPVPRRVANGFDFNRVSMLIAVLEKRLEVSFAAMDVYINVVGGLKIVEPASDLAIAASILSNLYDISLPNDMAVFGELGLAGEARPISHIQSRIGECQRLGFNSIIMPKQDLKAYNMADDAQRGILRIDSIKQLGQIFSNNRPSKENRTRA